MLFWFLPIGGEGGWFGYPTLWERVVFFPLGRLVSWLLLFGGDGYGLPAGVIGFMVTPHWRRGWGAWLLPAGGEGELHGYSPLGERVGEMVMVFLLGKLVSCCSPLRRGWVA